MDLVHQGAQVRQWVIYNAFCRESITVAVDFQAVAVAQPCLKQPAFSGIGFG